MTRRQFAIGRLGLMLTLAFLGVALAGILTFFLLSARTRGLDITNVVQNREATITSSAAKATTIAYQDAGGPQSPAAWSRASLGPVLTLLQSEGAKVQVRDVNGILVATSASFTSLNSATQRTAPVTSQGRDVGSVTLRFTRQISSIPSSYERDRLLNGIGAAGVALVLALAVGLVLSWWITMPVDLALGAMRRRASGERDYRISGQEAKHGARGLWALTRGFNQAADDIDARERAHRNLIADVAHELRTPVAVLQATHEAMLDGVTKPTAGNLASLREEVLRLARRVEDLQQLASAEAAAVQLHRVRSDLAEIAEDATSSLADAFDGAGVRVTRRLRPVNIRCDPERMREIITNLLTNALKFTPRGGRVVIGTGPGGDDNAVLTVADTGIGIPEQDLPRVTERFFRGQRSAEMAHGSGIGLTIVSGLVEAHRGQMTFSSQPGEGTEVTVSLPRAPDHQNA